MLNNITIGQYFPRKLFFASHGSTRKDYCYYHLRSGYLLGKFSTCVWLGRHLPSFAMLLSRLPLRLMWSAIKPLWIIIVFTMGIHLYDPR